MSIRRESKKTHTMAYTHAIFSNFATDRNGMLLIDLSTITYMRVECNSDSKLRFMREKVTELHWIWDKFAEIP